VTAPELAALERIANLVAQETGLCFRPGRGDIEAGVRKAMAGAKVADLQRYATLLETRQLSLDDLFGEVAVGETYFFREPQHFEFVRRVIFPDVVARRGAAHALRIWSAGCATGEEAYSLAITLIDEGVAGRVLATDLSRKSLQLARAATYRRWSLRGLDDSLIRRCFHESGDRWTLDERFRVPVTFECHNLSRSAQAAASAIWDMDLILCRNVFIYLDAATTRRVVHALAEALAPDGWLITGPSDPLLEGVASLRPVVTPHGVLYRKQASEVRAVLTTTLDPVTLPRHRRAAAATGTPAPAWSSDEEGIPAATAVERPRGGPSLASGQPASAGEPERALRTATAVADPSGVAGRIRAIANRDGAATALNELDRLIDRFPLTIELHILRAVLRIDSSRYDEAIESLRRALYLDRSLIVAHFLLATALRRVGDLPAARRAYRNAGDLARARPADEPIPFGDGEHAGTIAEVAGAECALLAAEVEA
jgi:chemotaxis protein methyltransferase CheR